MTDTQISAQTVAGPVYSVPQQRKIVTAIPGPKSQAAARPTIEGRLGRRLVGASRSTSSARTAPSSSTSTATSSSTSVPASASRPSATPSRRVVAGRRRASCRTSSTRSSRSRPTRSTCASPSCSPSTRPATAQKKSVLVNSGAEAVENGVKIARKYTGRRGVAVLDHAYHGRTNLTMAMNFKAMPYATGFGPFAGDVYRAPSSYPYHDGLSGADAAARTIALPREDRRRERPRVPRGRADPGRGRLHGARRRATCPRCRSGAPRTASSSSPTRSSRAWPAPARYFASEHFGWVPDLVLSAKGIAGGLPLAARHRPRRDHGRRPARRTRRHVRRQPGRRAPRRSPCSSRSSRTTCSPRPRASRRPSRPAARAAASERYDIIGEVRGIGAMIAIELVQPGTRDTTKSRTPMRSARSSRTPRSTACCCSPPAPTATCCASCRASRSATSCIEDGLRVLDDGLAALG